ncbi:MAG: uncharacterized protein JWR10_1684 [Rubritepida sp.]|nr:uncharacterized protein [Rubritepida sp.]
MRLKLGCHLEYSTTGPVPFVFNVEVQSFPGQAVEQETLSISPDLRLEHWTMPESGNRYFRVNLPGGPLSIRYTATVNVTPALDNPTEVAEIALSNLPLSVLPHLYPSRYCQSDKLDRFARSTFGHFHTGYSRVNAVCNWINEYVAYEGGVSDAMTSAFDTVTQRAGVCRDFAHLGIAICRALGIPARYISAYALRLYPPDFHAVFEAFLAGPHGPAWYVFDPTRLADPGGLVRIGVGRDAAEVAFSTIFGPACSAPPEVWIEALEPAPDVTVKAVRPNRA